MAGDIRTPGEKVGGKANSPDWSGAAGAKYLAKEFAPGALVPPELSV
jgi:hypothetical protein